MLYTNTTAAEIKKISAGTTGFGLTGHMFGKRCFKLRFNPITAERIMHYMHGYKSCFLIYRTKKNMILMAAIEPVSSPFWPALEEAIGMSKADIKYYMNQLKSADIQADFDKIIPEAPEMPWVDELPF